MASSRTSSGDVVFARVSGILQNARKPGQSDEEAGKTAEHVMRQFMSTQARWAAGLLEKLVKGEHAGAFDRMQPAVRPLHAP